VNQRIRFKIFWRERGEDMQETDCVRDWVSGT